MIRMTNMGAGRFSLAALAAGLGLSASASAATISFSTVAPTTTVNDRFNLTGTTADATNVQAGDDAATFVAADRNAQGQTFTTGANALGYRLTAVTLQHVTYSTFTNNFTAGGDFTVRVTQPLTATTLTPLGSETAALTGTEPNIFGTGLPANGTGRFITFTLATPVTLLPNTVYGFDVASPAGGVDPFFETNGTNTDPLAGGNAYSSGTTNTGVGGTNLAALTGDHVFVASLTAIPEPGSVGLLGLGAVGLLARRRRTA